MSEALAIGGGPFAGSRRIQPLVHSDAVWARVVDLPLDQEPGAAVLELEPVEPASPGQRWTLRLDDLTRPFAGVEQALLRSTPPRDALLFRVRAAQELVETGQPILVEPPALGVRATRSPDLLQLEGELPESSGRRGARVCLPCSLTWWSEHVVKHLVEEEELLHGAPPWPGSPTLAPLRAKARSLRAGRGRVEVVIGNPGGLSSSCWPLVEVYLALGCVALQRLLGGEAAVQHAALGRLDPLIADTLWGKLLARAGEQEHLSPEQEGVWHHVASPLRLESGGEPPCAICVVVRGAGGRDRALRLRTIFAERPSKLERRRQRRSRLFGAHPAIHWVRWQGGRFPVRSSEV